MFKQKGITALELIIGLSIMSGVSLYTIKMTEKVENAVVVYQDSVQDLKAVKEKLKLVKESTVSEDEELEALLASMDFDLEAFDEEVDVN